MKQKRSLLLFFSIILLGLVAFIPKAQDLPDNPQEKVYLHMDKSYYALGDTIWFKGYVTVGSRHQLSALSGSLYVDLITEQDSIITSLKLPVTAGMAMGDFTLHNELREGNYRIRAYTQWMRNAGEEYFFDRTFTVGTPASDGVLVKADYGYQVSGNKPILLADLNYTDDNGSPLSSKNVQYEVFINRKRAWGKSGQTDDKGNLSVSFTNDQQADLRGAFIRTIIEIDGKTKVIKDLPIKAGFANTDVQFFPESGNLVNGVTSRVAFKAVGVDGLGVKLKGSIIDEQNNEVSTFETLNAGMGSFLLKPESGKNYSAKVSFADGTVKVVPLPKALDDGYVLSVYQPNRDSILVRIYASKTKVDQAAQAPVNVNFIAGSGGETIISTSVKISRASSSFWLEKKSFPSGIAQFTLSNAAGEPLNERIAFIRSNDLMQLNVKTAKASYKSRERVQVDLEALSGEDKPTAGNFSVTVIDESKVPVEESMESTIFSNLLLTSNLKGYVEKPNYYFTKETDEVNRALDNLMLTQGYRRFVWKESRATNAATKPKFEAEGLGISISGKVLTLGGKVVPNATVLMMAIKAGAMKTDTTDAEGRFKFDKIFLTNSIGFSIQARLGKSSKLEVILDSIPKMSISKNKNIADVSTNIAGTIKAYIENGKKLDNLYERMGQLHKVQRLKEVEIRGRKPKGLVWAQQGPLQIPEGHSDRTFIMKNPEEFPTLSIGLQGRLGQIRFVDDIPQDVGVILDGRKVYDIEEIRRIFNGTDLNAEDVVKIEVVNKNMALISMLGGPALMIYTKTGQMSRRAYNPSIANITPKGFNKAREFYAPRYDKPGSSNPLPDLRSTIHWNPAVKTFSTGKTTFDYFNADGPGDYKVIVEGINAAGELGRTVYRYQVEQGDPAVMAMAASKDANNVTPIAEDSGILAIRKALDTIRKNLPIEKLYIHTDKPYYNIGDTLWFKSYVRDGDLNPSKQSGLLYVELDDDSAEVVRRISIPLKEGMGWAQIPLDKKNFHEGGYTLRAYTNWMQNFGEDYIFKKRFYLGVPKANTWLVQSDSRINRVDNKDQLEVELDLKRTDKTAVALRDVEVMIYEDRRYLYKQKLQTGLDGKLKFSKALKEKADGRNIRVEIRSLHPADGNQLLQVPLDVNRNQKIDLQFLPEGGHLVAGLKSRVGFKALAEDGKGIDVSGSILDNKGTEVAKFETLHNGMGSFDFTPAINQAYSAVLINMTENTRRYPLPLAKTSGTVLTIKNDRQSENLQVNLAATENIFNPDSSYYLTGSSNGRAYYSKKITGKDNIQISKSLFPTGISKITLLKGKRTINERMIFIDHGDHLDIKIIENKKEYGKRDSVGLEIEVKDKSGMPVKGNFSLAVTDNSQVKPDSLGNYSIAASLLLNSALKGTVEAPGYYLSDKTENAWHALDNLMLTQGWTGYSWTDAFNPSKPKFQAEKEFVVKGQVTNLSKKPVANAPVLISSKKPSFITTTTTDENGRYVFKNLPKIDSGSFFIQTRTDKGKQMRFGGITVEKFHPPKVPSNILDPTFPWYVNTDLSQVNYVNRIAEQNDESKISGEGIQLKEVKIEKAKIIKSFWHPNGWETNADLAYNDQEIKASGVMDLYQLLEQKIPGFKIKRAWEIPGGPVMFAFGKYLGIPALDMTIDGRPIPLIEVNDTTSVEQYIESLRHFQVETFMSLEILYRGVGKWKLPQIRGHYYAVIKVSTSSGTGYHIINNPDVTSYRPLPIMYPKEFYSPKYKMDTKASGAPDYRSTLFWAPNIYTDANGKARVSFYTSDATGNYNINMEGISDLSNLGSANVKIKVK